MLTRRVRLLAVGLVVTLGLVGTMLVDAPTPTMTVEELLASPVVGTKVAVRGEVVDGSIDNASSVFLIGDGFRTLSISFLDASVSNGLDDNRTIYAEGVLGQIDGSWVVHATVIKTSCPSKYEESSTSD
jgi:hypothetical protein